MLVEMLLFSAVTGSKAYGLDNSKSDIDIKEVFLNPPNAYFGINDVNNHYEEKNGGVDLEGFELRKFIRLALKNNPTILEMLYCKSHYLHPLFVPIVDNKEEFVSRLAYKAYMGYATHQRNRISAESYKERPKMASHLIRLMIACEFAMNSGSIMVDVGKHQDLLLEIKAGCLPFEKLEEIYKNYLTLCEDAYNRSRVKDFPDFALINGLVVELYKNYLVR